MPVSPSFPPGTAQLEAVIAGEATISHGKLVLPVSRTPPTMFHDITHNCDEQEEDRQYILDEVLVLFFKIRIHHKCKRMMEEHRSKRNISGKQKGLRKALKTSTV